MSEIKEIDIVPSKDIVSARWVRYRGDGGRLVEYIAIETEHGRLFIQRNIIGQLFRYLDANISDIRSIHDYRERDRELLRVLRNCDKELVFSVHRNTVVRIVSSDFTAVPHSKVIQIVEKVLKLNYENRELSFDRGMLAKWTLRSLPPECVEVGDIVSWQLWVYNYNDGRHGLRIGAGFTVLKCKNGAIGWKSAAKVRIIHRGVYEDLLSKIHEAVDRIVNTELPMMAFLIKESQRVKATKEHVEHLIKQYPRWIQRKLREQLRKAHTVWDISNAFSYVATHEPVTFNQRIQLSNHAVEVLKLVERR